MIERLVSRLGSQLVSHSSIYDRQEEADEMVKLLLAEKVRPDLLSVLRSF